MTGALLPILIVIAIIGVAVTVSGLAWPSRVLRDVGRTGHWFHHQDMDPPEGQPDGNANDPAIEHRPLRGRY
jgi:hypothetical protein